MREELRKEGNLCVHGGKSYCLVDLEAEDEQEPCCFIGEPPFVVRICESFSLGPLSFLERNPSGV